MTDTIRGTWEGLMHDVEGFSARASLDLEGAHEVKGAFSYQLTGDDHCEDPQGGSVRGEVGKEGRVTLEAELEGDVVIRFEGRRAPVRTHAEAAIVGTYTVGGRGPTGGGTAIFWRFKDLG